MLNASREMVKSDSGFRLLINRLKAYGDTNQVVEILYSPEISPDLRADRFSQWADLDPENKFVQRCATRSLIAAGRHREAQNQLQRWLLWDSHGAEPNALLSETYRHMKRADLADSCAHRANLAAQDDLMSTPGFIRISACPDIRDFARAFREKHGCPYHIEESGQSLIHFHHWRTGGTTLRDCFQNLFDPSQVFVFGDFRDPYLKSRQELLDAAVEIRREFQFVSIHHALPAHYFFSDKFAYFTFLRDPLQTAVSWYHWHVRNIKRDPQWLDPDIKNGLSIRGYAEKILRNNNGNLLTRWLINLDSEPDLGNRHRGLPSAVWEMSDDELSERAMLSLEKYFVFVGLTERFDESLFALCLLLNSDCIPLYEWKGHSGVGGEAIANIDADVREMLQEANSADNDLFQKIRQQFFDRYGNTMAWFNDHLAPFHDTNARQFEPMIGPRY